MRAWNQYILNCEWKVYVFICISFITWSTAKRNGEWEKENNNDSVFLPLLIVAWGVQCSMQWPKPNWILKRSGHLKKKLSSTWYMNILLVLMDLLASLTYSLLFISFNVIRFWFLGPLASSLLHMINNIDECFLGAACHSTKLQLFLLHHIIFIFISSNTMYL